MVKNEYHTNIPNKLDLKKTSGAHFINNQAYTIIGQLNFNRALITPPPFHLIICLYGLCIES